MLQISQAGVPYEDLGALFKEAVQNFMRFTYYKGVNRGQSVSLSNIPTDLNLPYLVGRLDGHHIDDFGKEGSGMLMFCLKSGRGIC